MSTTDQEVACVSDPALVRLSPDERAEPPDQMNRILQYCESLEVVETEAIEPMHALQPANALRCDEERPCMPLNAVFANVSDSEKIFSKFQKS
jgi:aspartyl/glutamyl-tRNA(Asn/Gln) amidotransferase C subunit